MDLHHECTLETCRVNVTSLVRCRHLEWWVCNLRKTMPYYYPLLSCLLLLSPPPPEVSILPQQGPGPTSEDVDFGPGRTPEGPVYLMPTSPETSKQDKGTLSPSPYKYYNDPRTRHGRWQDWLGTKLSALEPM